MTKRRNRRIFLLLILAGLIAAGCWAAEHVTLRPASGEPLPAQAPGEGVGRNPAVIQYLSPADAEAVPSLEIACETDAVLPDWWDPDSAVLMWSAEPKKDLGSPDWDYNTSLVGWDGRRMEVWEMDLFSRIFYREFWQPNLTLCEAGCDAMLRLWELNGGTMFETLSHVNENGSYAFSTYPGVWEEYYDTEGLAWCRAFCEKRFYEGPTWTAQYFRKGQYHDWDEWSPIPAYEIDGIYFSAAKEGQ